MRIEVNIEAQLEELWRRMGIDEDQIEEFYEELNQRVQDLFKAFLKENLEKIQELTNQAEAAEEELRLQIERFNLDEDAQVDESAPLLARIDAAKRKLKELEKETKGQKEEYVTTFEELRDCFDTLGIEDRGEFAELGKDFGWEKIDRMTERIKRLKAEIEERRPKMDEICDEINELRVMLGMEEIDPRETLSDRQFQEAEYERDELREHVQKNKEEVLKLAKDVRWLERALKKKESATDGLTVVSDDTVNMLRARLAELERQKDDHVPELIDAMRKELLQLWADMHVPVPSATEFPFVYKGPINRRTLVALESEVLRLENLKQHISPMLDLIAAREEILTQYKQLTSAAADPSRLTSRRGKAASVVAEEDRIRKRYNIELPKIQARLLEQLQEYEETFGERFMWDGEDLFEVVSAAQKKNGPGVSRMSRVSNTSRRGNGPRGKGTTRAEDGGDGKGKGEKVPNRLAKRAPFQLKEFML